MLKERNLQEEINASLKTSYQRPVEEVERLNFLKNKLNSISYFETSLSDYEKWLKEYNDLVGR